MPELATAQITRQLPAGGGWCRGRWREAPHRCSAVRMALQQVLQDTVPRKLFAAQVACLFRTASPAALSTFSASVHLPATSRYQALRAKKGTRSAAASVAAATARSGGVIMPLLKMFYQGGSRGK